MFPARQSFHAKVTAADVGDPLSALHGSPDETGIKLAALGVAVAIHLAALLVNLPSLTSPVVTAQRRDGPIVVKRYIPPPPRLEQPRQVARPRLTRKLPVPDPTPDAPEPIREPEVLAPTPVEPGDFEMLIGEPEPPPASGGTAEVRPLLAGVDANNPVRIDSAYVQPKYPDLARIARIEANVVLQAVIESDGSVGEVHVLRCSRPGFGFEDASIEAVSQWRYEPATQNDVPVAVYFTIMVEFTLL